MATYNFVVRGTELIKQGIQKDIAEQYEAALPLYSKGVQYLLTGLQREHNEAVRGAIKQKIAKYLARAEEIKSYFDTVEEDKEPLELELMMASTSFDHDEDDDDDDGDNNDEEKQEAFAKIVEYSQELQRYAQTCERQEKKLNKHRLQHNDNEVKVQSLRQLRIDQQRQIDTLKTESNEYGMKIQFLEEQLSSIQQDYQRTLQELVAERAKHGKKIDTNQYLQWQSDEVVDWILSLENGVFADYEETIRASFKSEQVTGATLHMLDRYELRGLGIKLMPHRNVLMQHISNLLQQNAIQNKKK